MKIKLGVLKSFKSAQKWNDQYKEACESLNIECVEIDLLSNNWIEEVKNSNVDGFLVRVLGNMQEHKSLFDERLFIINEELGIPIYPSRKELYLYENKRLYAYWLTIHNYKHPKTWVFYKKNEAISFLKNTSYPKVFKTSGGASASGVTIIKSRFRALEHCRKVFGRFEPRLSLGKTHWRKGLIRFPQFGMSQKHYLIVQEFLNVKWEWRIIKIGESYFGHQKLLKGQFASGSGLVGWVNPPKELLFLVKDLCDKGKFDSMAMDVLETVDGGYYINEIQSLFGSYKPYQMKVDDIPGRYVLKGNNFVFEKGEFNKLGSNILRIEDFIKKISNKYYQNNLKE